MVSGTPDWLPQLVPFTDSGGDWQTYLNTLYAWFQRDFIDSKPVFRGRRLELKRLPMSMGKVATFWHMTSEGSDGENRTPDLRRCERIRIWLADDEDYVVVLADRRGFPLP